MGCIYVFETHYRSGHGVHVYSLNSIFSIDLTVMCSYFQIKNLNTLNSHYVERSAGILSLKELKSSVNAFLEDIFLDIIKVEEFLDLEYSELKAILSSEE